MLATELDWPRTESLLRSVAASLAAFGARWQDHARPTLLTKKNPVASSDAVLAEAKSACELIGL